MLTVIQKFRWSVAMIFRTIIFFLAAMPTLLIIAVVAGGLAGALSQRHLRPPACPDRHSDTDTLFP